jgi:hypothetical protein
LAAPLEIRFNARKEIAALPVVTDLDAANRAVAPLVRKCNMYSLSDRFALPLLTTFSGKNTVTLGAW